MSLEHKRELADRYPRLLAMAQEAEKRGLDQSARFEELLRFSRLQILSAELARDLHDESQKVSEKDVEEYYRRNSAAFEQVDLERIIVPRLKQMPPQKGVSDVILRAQKKQGEDAMAKVAEELHIRAVAGEDFVQLQKEAYQASGNRGNEPPTNVTSIRRANLPGPHAAVFNLKPGQVSQPIDDPNGYYIYKLNRKGVELLDAVSDEIRSTLQEQRMRDELQKIQQSFSPEVNKAYFGVSP
jgi:parvulin-like peptidyl-prolyl isomerase